MLVSCDNRFFIAVLAGLFFVSILLLRPFISSNPSVLNEGQHSPTLLVVDERAPTVLVVDKPQQAREDLLTPPPSPPVLTTAWTWVLNKMGPVHKSRCKFEAFGHEDGAKLICIDAFLAKNNCWVMSIGSNGDFSFERDVFLKTSCAVHIFDCTGDWQVPEDISSRVSIHKKCIGSRPGSGDYLPYESLIAIADKKQPPSYLKMDIEGFEFSVLPEILRGSDHLLPSQIAFELHVLTNINAGDVWAYNASISCFNLKDNASVESLFSKLNKSARNYTLVSRTDNPYCGWCSEVVVISQESLIRGGLI